MSGPSMSTSTFQRAQENRYVFNQNIKTALSRSFYSDRSLYIVYSPVTRATTVGRQSCVTKSIQTHLIVTLHKTDTFCTRRPIVGDRRALSLLLSGAVCANTSRENSAVIHLQSRHHLLVHCSNAWTGYKITRASVRLTFETPSP